MRKLFVYLVMGILCACEVIDEAERLIPVETEPQGNRTHVLIEYTGFRCVNCPTAAELAKELKQLYQERLIVVSLHPASNPFTQGKYDYTCPAADSIYRWMGGTATTPFPAGNMDMKPYNDEWFADMSVWSTMVYNAMKDTVVPPINEMEKSYWLVEDSVLGVQAMPDGSVNTHYYHRHVLRDVNANKAHLEIKDSFDSTQLYILTLYMDPKDKHIVQAYEEKISSDFDLSD